jgi:GH15 family glucan-1,4-alpha-glucosidase
LDASTLLAAIFGFLPPDERVRASVLAIADELTENGFVLRYRTEETDDGLSGKEGTCLICSFWPCPRWRSSARSSVLLT